MVGTVNSGDPIEQLISRSVELEGRAARLQAEKEVGLDAAAIRELTEDYHRWYADSLNHLPADLAERFRAEYEGKWHTSRIKQFLESGDKRSELYQEPEPGRPAIFPYWRVPFDTSFRPGILSQRQVLIEASTRRPEPSATTAAVSTVERIGRRFSAVVRQVSKTRRDGTDGFKVESEYDMQQLVHGLLLLHFEDVRPEDPASRFAGASSRIDFVLKAEHVVVETKFMRESLTVKEVGDELLADIGRYQTHPDCQAIVAIIYDPNFRISNPRELESDLTTMVGKLRVVVVVAQG